MQVATPPVSPDISAYSVHPAISSACAQALRDAQNLAEAKQATQELAATAQASIKALANLVALTVPARNPQAWLVGLQPFRTFAAAMADVRNPDLVPEPLYRATVTPCLVSPKVLSLISEIKGMAHPTLPPTKRGALIQELLDLLDPSEPEDLGPAALPTGVCFSESRLDFYHAETGHSMGSQFYDNWRDRADEFPSRYVARAALKGSGPGTAAGNSAAPADALDLIKPEELSAFVTVPATEFPDGHVEPAFRVGRYLCSKDAAGRAVVDATLPPWVEISYDDARTACAAAGFSLITERQALAIAINIAGQAANWSGGAVGEGDLFQGLRKGAMRKVQPGNFVPETADEQRWFVLSNGEHICDAVGNAYTWVFDNVQGDEDGLMAEAFAADSPTITVTPHPWLEAGNDYSGYALVRGGCFRPGDAADAIRLFGWPGHTRGRVGFRCTNQIWPLAFIESKT